METKIQLLGTLKGILLALSTLLLNVGHENCFFGSSTSRPTSIDTHWKGREVDSRSPSCSDVQKKNL
jgi:hypothetical protein